MGALQGGIGRPFERLSDRVGANVRAEFFQFAPGAFSWAAPEDGVAIVHAWSGGGSGSTRRTDSSTRTPGGSGGTFGRKVVQAAKAQVISGTVGAGGPLVDGLNDNGVNGGDTTVTIPGLAPLALKGGFGGVLNADPMPPLGASGPWDEAATGGVGAYTSAATPGQGTYGGAAGVCSLSSSESKAGGGAGGPNVQGPLRGGAGGNATYVNYGIRDGAFPGGGGMGEKILSGSAPGGQGRSGGDGVVLIEFYAGASL